MTRVLLESLNEKLYSDPTSNSATQRLVDCLPEFNGWSKSAWEGIPDKGVEVSLAVLNGVKLKDSHFSASKSSRVWQL